MEAGQSASMQEREGENKQVLVDLIVLQQLLPPDAYQQVLAHSTPVQRPPATAILLNTVMGFGLLAIAAASVALFPSALVTLLVGALTWAAGMALTHAGPQQWQLFAFMCVTIGSLTTAAGIVSIEGDGEEAPRSSLLAITALFTCTAVAVKSSLMTVLATLALAMWFGSEAFYCDSCYAIIVERPLVTVCAFTVLAVLMHLLYRRLDRLPWSAGYGNLALISSRTSLFMTQLGFLVGSLWGDYIRAGHLFRVKISSVFIAVLWALQLVAGMLWAARYERRWALYTMATFAAIHAYTQWFERLGAQPWSVLLAGLLTLLFVAGVRSSTVRKLVRLVYVEVSPVLGPPRANPEP